MKRRSTETTRLREGKMQMSTTVAPTCVKLSCVVQSVCQNALPRSALPGGASVVVLDGQNGWRVSLRGGQKRVRIVAAKNPESVVANADRGFIMTQYVVARICQGLHDEQAREANERTWPDITHDIKEAWKSLRSPRGKYETALVRRAVRHAVKRFGLIGFGEDIHFSTANATRSIVIQGKEGRVTLDLSVIQPNCIQCVLLVFVTRVMGFLWPHKLNGAPLSASGWNGIKSMVGRITAATRDISRRPTHVINDDKRDDHDDDHDDTYSDFYYDTSADDHKKEQIALQHGVNRLDILLALDEYIYDDGPWSGANPTALAAEIAERYHHASYPFILDCVPKGAADTYKSLLSKQIDLHSTTSDVDILWKKLSAMDSGMMVSGWTGHAVGVYYRKVGGGGDLYELAIENTGQGTNWHGACPDPISIYHPEVAGILVFKPVSADIFKDVCKRMLMLIQSRNINDTKNLCPAFFYRFVWEPVFKGDPFANEWVVPWRHKAVAFYVRLPLQTGGDCAFRSIFFVALASPSIASRPVSSSSSGGAIEIPVPLWFWEWYGRLVAVSVGVLVDKRAELLFTQSEFACLRDRTESLALFFQEADKKAGKLQGAIDNLKQVAVKCRDGINNWYDNTILTSSRLLNDVQVVHVHEAAVYVPNTANVRNDEDGSTMIKPDNTVRVRREWRLDADLRSAMDTYTACNTWADLAKVGDALRSKKLTMDKHRISVDLILCRADVIGLSHALFRMLSSAQTPTGDDDALGALYEIVTSNTEINRYYDMVLLYALCYIALRKILASNKAYDPVFAKFGEVRMACFDVPVHSRAHAQMVDFVRSETAKLRVLADPAACLDPLEILYFKINTSTDRKKSLADLHKDVGKALDLHKIEWKKPLVYLDFHRYMQPVLSSPFTPDQYTVPMLIFLSSVFNHGSSYANCIPHFIANLVDLAFLPMPPFNNTAYAMDRVDMLNPFKRSLEVLFDVSSHTNSDSTGGGAFRSPSDFYITYGVVSPRPQDTSFSVNLTPISYNGSTLQRPMYEHLPNRRVATDVIDGWIARLADPNDAYTMMCNTVEWNLTVYALIYLDGMYGNPDHARYAALTNDMRCGKVVKLLVALLDGRVVDDAVTWSNVLNGPCKDNEPNLGSVGILRQVKLRFMYISEDKHDIYPNLHDDRIPVIRDEFLRGSAAEMKYSNQDISYDWILNHMCHLAASRWKDVRPSMPQPQQLSWEEMQQTVHGIFLDSIGARVPYCLTDTPNTYTATMTLFQHYGREIALDIALPATSDAAAKHKAVNASFHPVTPQKYVFKVKEDDKFYHLVIQEPLPPHPYFQTQFTWRADEKAGAHMFYGEPTSTNILKMNNYCLVYDATSKHVMQVAPRVDINNNADARCDLLTLDKAVSSATKSVEYVPMDAVISSKGQLQLQRLCARLLCFCYIDRLLVWRYPSTGEHRVELLSHGTTLAVSKDGVVTFAGGMEMLQEAPSAEWAFWTYQMPSVFLAADRDNRYLVIFDVHHKDPGVIVGCTLGGLFGKNDNAVEMEHAQCSTPLMFHAYCMAKQVDIHSIKVHPSGLVLLPSSIDALYSLHTNAHRFGRTDVVNEIARITSEMSALFRSTNGRPQDRTNFGREVPSASFETSVSDPIHIVRKVTHLYDSDGSQREVTPMLLLEYGEGWVDQKPGVFVGPNMTWTKASTHVAEQHPEYDKTLSQSPAAAPPPSSVVLFRRGVDNTRHRNIMHDMTDHIAEFLRERKQWGAMPRAYAQFMYLKHMLPREDQVVFANGVTQNFESEVPEIHNLLMGAGKTSVITPLVIMNSVYGIRSVEVAAGKDRIVGTSSGSPGVSIVVVMPNKLVQQTTRLLLEFCLYMDVPIREVLKDEPNFWDESAAPGASAAASPTLYGGTSKTPKIYVASDRVLKESLIRRTASAPPEFRYLLDEADMMMNPFTSELNMPREVAPFCAALTKENKQVLEQCLAPVIDFLLSAKKDKSSSNIPARVLQHLRTHIVPYVLTREHRLHYGFVACPETVRQALVLLEAGVGTSKDEETVKRHHQHIILAVPYLFADVPSAGSEFSDPLLTVAFTIASLQIRRLDNVQLHSILMFMLRHVKAHESTVGKYRDFAIAPNRWRWVADNIATLQADDAMLHAYVHHFVPKMLTVFESTLSACGMDLIMSGFQKLRSGFTGTPEDITILDSNPIRILPKILASVDMEAAAMAKLTYDDVPSDVDLQTHVISQLAKGAYSVIIDVGSQFLGISPTDLLCRILEASSSSPSVTEIVFWNAKDEPTIMNRAGVASPWSGNHRPGQVVYYDHAHTTGTDAVLMPDVSACITVRDTTRYRDFIQGLFRLRKIVSIKETRCAVVMMPDPKKMTNQGLPAILSNNDLLYVRSQNAIRAQHNALALIRSRAPIDDSDSRVVETSIGYLRKPSVPFQQYLLRTIEAAAKKYANVRTELTALRRIIEAGPSISMEGHVENEVEQDQEQEQEQEKERMQIFDAKFDPLKFALLLNLAQHTRVCKPATLDGGKLKVLKNFDIFGVGLTMATADLFRPLVVTINGGKVKVAVMFTDGILLMDYLNAAKPAGVTVRISDRENHVWFEYGRVTRGGSRRAPPCRLLK
jgi:hypothetical protein